MTLSRTLQALIAARALLSASARKPSAADLHDALRYFNDMNADRDEEDGGFGRELTARDLKFKGITLMDPKRFIDDASHLGRNGAGWLKEMPEDEWAEALKDEYDRDFEHIIEAYQHNTLTPGVQIDGQMADGRGRSMFFYGIGEKITVAQYDVKPADDAIEIKFKPDHRLPSPAGWFIATKGGKKVGAFQFYGDNRNEALVHGASLRIDPSMRNTGLGTAILEHFKGWLNSMYPKMTYYGHEATSQGSYRLVTRVFGKPLMVHNGLTDFDPDEAEKHLKHAQGREDKYGIVADDYLEAVHWIGRGSAPANHPWAK
jgi:GNAT superfamily N-acetyltransferase